MLQPVELPPMEAHHIDATTGRDELADLPDELRDEIRMIDKAIAARGRGGAAVAEAPKRMPLQTRKSDTGLIRPHPPPGARFRATRSALAVRARSTSSAMADLIEQASEQRIPGAFTPGFFVIRRPSYFDACLPAMRSDNASRTLEKTNTRWMTTSQNSDSPSRA